MGGPLDPPGRSRVKYPLYGQLRTVKSRRVRSFFGGRGEGVHFKLVRTSCQQSLKYTSLYNKERSPFSTEKRNIFLYK